MLQPTRRGDEAVGVLGRGRGRDGVGVRLRVRVRGRVRVRVRVRYLVSCGGREEQAGYH